MRIAMSLSTMSYVILKKNDSQLLQSASVDS